MELYYTNRTFTVVNFNIVVDPPVALLNAEAERLTDIVKGDPIITNSSDTRVIEKEGIALGYTNTTAEAVWNTAVGALQQVRQYPCEIRERVGWVRGTRPTGVEWGAYLWMAQNRIVFRPAATNWWRASSGGVLVEIKNVIVGSLGIYPPLEPVVDEGPHLDEATNYPGADRGESREFRVDISNVFYQVLIPNIWLRPKQAFACVGGSNTEFMATGTNIPRGVDWLIYPTNFAGHADFYLTTTNSAWVTPGTVATNYKIRATSKDNTNFYDEADLTVVKVEIENTAQRDTEDIQVQYFTNNAGVFTYTAIPLQIYYRLQPDSGWTPDSVELKVKNPAGSTVRTVTLPISVGQQQTTWDGKDSSGNYVANGSNYVIEITATIGGTTCTATNGLTVYEIRQGDCVYRPIIANEHAAVLYEYIGGNQLSDIQNSNKYTVMESPGTGGTTGPSNYGNYDDWIGAYCPQGLSIARRKAILEKAHELDDANIPYVSALYLDTLTHNSATNSPAGSDWAGTVGDIANLRCDGMVEVAYEDTGEQLYGGNTWWNIMAPGAGAGSNLALHNDGADSINPNRQRNGINAAHDLTRNRPDAIHLP